ncbi:MAG: prepilin-type N-terminal cleavage/methylation domain-containing protein [bacterium]|nr:prepilin-type N-terminal cleavage/methylation domain-containing protein [bacterium]
MTIKNFKNIILKIKKTNRGVSLVELLFYIAVFSVLFLVVINSMIFMTRSFRETVINTDLTQSANIMERMSREIRSASAINTLSSTSLKLDIVGINPTPGSPESGVRFTLSGTNIELYDGSNALIGNLNSPNISVTALNFTQISTSEGSAVKVFMTVKSKRYNSVRTENFYDTVVLRGSYQ